MKIEDARKIQCLRSDKLCGGDECMAWLPVNPDDLSEGVCMYLGLSTALMKVLHIWSQMVMTPKSPIVGG